MKAIRVEEFGGPEMLRLIEVAVPRPEKEQILVRIHAAGVNPVETYIRSGTYAYRPPLPYTPGSDGAGIIAELGQDISGFDVGDRVYIAGSLTGTYAEFALCSSNQLHRLPESVSFAQGASIGVPYATAYRAVVQRARATPDETLLVHGASGGVGIAAVQIACSHGLRVFGTAGTERGRELVAQQGAEHVFDHRAPDYLQRILEATGGRGVNVVIEMLANVNLGKDLTILPPGGRVVVVGSRGPVEIDPRQAMTREADIRGMVLGNTPAAELSMIHQALAAGLESGALKPVVRQELPLSSAAEAHRLVMQPGALGKIVLLP